MSLFKNKSVSEPTDASAKNYGENTAPVSPRQKKGPTPTRKTQEAKHYRGIVGGDKKAAKARAREESRRRLELEQEGLRTGREDLLPAMHQGAARRAVRNYIDSRYTFSEWMIVLILILMFGGLIAVSIISQSNEALAFKINTWSMILSYVFLIGGCVEGAFFAGRARKHAIDRLGEDKIPRGLRWYAFSRLVMPRRLRQPRPQVSRSWRGNPED